MNQICLLITTYPNMEEASSAARSTVEQALAACAQIQAPCTSIYEWNGSLEQNQEYPVHFKTSLIKKQALKEFIKKHHSYEVPEIVAIDLDVLNQDYAAWVVKQTAGEC